MGAYAISQAGLDFIKSWEGFSLKAYQDGGGVWTIGWGTIAGVKPGMTITRDQAEAMLMKDLAAADKEIARVVKVPLEQHEYDALVSFEFNTGGLMLMTRKGTEYPSQVLRALNAGSKAEAADHLLDWVKDNGVFVQGLMNRRRAERQIFRGLKP
jgi:lysozyme